MDGSVDSMVRVGQEFPDQRDPNVLMILGGKGMEMLMDTKVNYLGLIDFGTGNIPGTSKENFLSLAGQVQQSFLERVAGYNSFFGSCMDGRGYLTDAAGTVVTALPQVIGGPSLFAYEIAEIGGFSIVKGKTIEDRFLSVIQFLCDKKFRLGMHEECGAGAGVAAVAEKQLTKFDELLALTGADAQHLARVDNGRHPRLVKSGLERLHNLASKDTDFGLAKMIDLTRRVQGANGDQAISLLHTNHTHPQHGHTEGGLLFTRGPELFLKNKFTEETDQELFVQNGDYATSIVDALATTVDERERGLIIADHYALAGVATLGKDQQVGEIAA